MTFVIVDVAERQGFEPWVPARVQRFSRPPRSTTPAPFLGFCGDKVKVFILFVKIYFCDFFVCIINQCVMTIAVAEIERVTGGVGVLNQNQ